MPSPNSILPSSAAAQREPPPRLPLREWVRRSRCSRPADFPRHKVCGEFVSAESLDLLAGLLQDVPETADLLAKAPVIDRTRLLFGGRMIEVKVAPAGLSISRYDLDALLWEAAERAGVDVHPNCEVTASDGDGPFTLQTSRPDLYREGLDRRGRTVVAVHR